MSVDLAAGLADLERRALDAGSSLGLPADAPQKLIAFRDLLLKWNKVYNLTALRHPDEMLSHHLLDSLAILPHLAAGPLLDVGSGGGLPGLPLAIARPALAVTLVDAVQKKTTFLQQAVIELGLTNVTVRHARVEALAGAYAQIVSRAFADLPRFVGLTRPLLAAGGRWLAMKGQSPDEEIAALPAGVGLERIVPLVVPDLDAERCLVILRAAS